MDVTSGEQRGLLDGEEDFPWLSMGMIRAEKQEARKPWQMSVIVKLDG